MKNGIPHLSRRALLALMFLIIGVCMMSSSHESFGASTYRPNLAVLESAALASSPSAWTILDARNKKDWQSGHIAGSRSFSWEDYTRTDSRGVQYKIFSRDELARILGSQGIARNTPILIYGDADKSWGGEGWLAWMFAWLGHQGPIRVLNGGVQAWKQQGHPVVSGNEQPTVKPATYVANVQPQFDISLTELGQRAASYTLIDTRSTMEWLMGKIPGAIHIPWEKFYSGKERRPLSPAALKKLLADHGVPLNKQVVYYCLGGIRSGYTWMVHELSGLPGARNYEGGFEEWKKAGKRP